MRSPAPQGFRSASARRAALIVVGAGVVGLGGWQAWASYTPESDGMLTVAGVFLVLVDLFVVWALRAARREYEDGSR